MGICSAEVGGSGDEKRDRKCIMDGEPRVREKEMNLKWRFRGGVRLCGNVTLIERRRLSQLTAREGLGSSRESLW